MMLKDSFGFGGEGLRCLRVPILFESLIQALCLQLSCPTIVVHDGETL